MYAFYPSQHKHQQIQRKHTKIRVLKIFRFYSLIQIVVCDMSPAIARLPQAVYRLFFFFFYNTWQPIPFAKWSTLIALWSISRSTFLSTQTKSMWKIKNLRIHMHAFFSNWKQIFVFVFHLGKDLDPACMFLLGCRRGLKVNCCKNDLPQKFAWHLLTSCWGQCENSETFSHTLIHTRICMNFLDWKSTNTYKKFIKISGKTKHKMDN